MSQIKRFGTKESIPTEEVFEFIKNALTDNNGIIVIATNGVVDLNKKCEAQILTIKVNPYSVANAIINQALNAGDKETMLALCDELIGIGALTSNIIRAEIQKRKTQN